MKYTPTIGLEVHAELATKSKMFCGCANDPHSGEVNAHTCPVCLGHPGTLPVPNGAAVGMVLRFGQAIGATLADYSEFDRKNYFYPDIPKAYQISQYKYPFLSGGNIQGVDLTRVHLEEDTARSSHELSDGSLVDFNRAGVPLMELVTEPVIKTSSQAGDFARELQLLMQTLGISDANMERGEMRIEANVSISPDPNQMSKTYTELKNINSFKAVEAAIEYEITRQQEVLESGGEIVQETRGWDDNKSRTFSQRSKETAKDYRYFPDPDIPKLQISEIADFAPQALSAQVPTLPAEKRATYQAAGIADKTIETIISDRPLDRLFADISAATDDTDLLQLSANYVSVDLAGLQTNSGFDVSTVDATAFLGLMQLLHDGTIGSRGAKDLLSELSGYTGDVQELAEQKGLLQLSDTASLVPVVASIVAAHPDQVAEFKAGKETVLKFLVGQGMKETKGAANPQVLEELLRAELGK